MEPASALHLPCCPWRQRFPDASTCPCTLMSTQHLHCSPFIPRTLRIPAVPAGWVGSGESLPRRVGAGGPHRLSTHEGATSSRGSFLDWALFDVPSALAGCSQVGAHHEFPPALLLFNCSFLLPFSATRRGTSSLSPSRRFYDFGEVVLGRWDREKEAVIKLQADPARLGLFLLVSSAVWLLTCLYPAASLLETVWYFLVWPKGFLFVIRFSLQTSWRIDSMPLSSDWMVHKALNL